MFDLLKGVRVLDFSQYVTEVVGGHLADLGAEVIKIEPPPVGSLSRHGGGYIMQMARNKKSLAINLRAPEAQEAFGRLLMESDLVVDGLRSGALDELGFGFEAAKEFNPAIVYLSISGWGQNGPYRRLASHGQAFDSFSGMEPVVWEDGLPRSVEQSAIELSAQMGCFYGTVGAIAALFQARGSGQGVHVDVSEGEAGAWYHWGEFLSLLNGESPRSGGPGGERRTRYRVYPTKDEGGAVYFMALERKFWQNFCDAIGRSDLAARGDWSRGSDPGGYEGEYEELIGIFRTKTKQEWMDTFIQHDIAGGPVNTVAGMLEDNHFLSRNPFVDIQDYRTGKRLKTLGSPIKIKGRDFVANNPPRLGENTSEILSSLGYGQDQIADLVKKAVVLQA